jgi:hypothetical protein
MKTARNHWDGVVLAFLAAGLLAGGCVNVQTPREINVGNGAYRWQNDGGGSDDGKVSKDEAYRLAYQVARDADVDPEDYDVHDKGIGANRWVLFEHKSPRESLGWKNHFAVRVSGKGQATLFRVQ